MAIVNLHIKVKFTEEVLGTASANKELHREFIAKKAPDAKSREEEIAALGVDEVEHKDMTVFPRLEDGTPFMYDYQWKGYFKDCCGMLRNASGFKSKSIKAYKKKIDGLVFVKQRKVPFIIPDEGEMDTCQRPLRASTAQGERVALANSETVPAGSCQEFDIMILEHTLEPYVIEWLDYGILHGTGQWRNSGKGRFVYEAYDDDGELVAGTMGRI